MWQLLLKILEFEEWQDNSSLHKRGPNSAPLRRYKSWNTSLESGELVQICTLWEQKLAHKVKGCNSAGSPLLIFHLGCTPANMFCNFASLLVLTSSGFYRKRRTFSPTFTFLKEGFISPYFLCSSRKWRRPEETLCSTFFLLHKDARYYLCNAPHCLEKTRLEQNMQVTSVPCKQCHLQAAAITPYPVCHPSLPFTHRVLNVHM